MNGKAHSGIVLKVNQALGGPFPENELAAGAVDPDRKVYGSYRGDEYKHHFDGVSTGSSRNDTPVIRRTVWRRLQRARESWLCGDTAGAAFHFGVASHYLLDGLILSPSVSEDEHSRGDRTFSRRVRKMSLPPGNRPRRTGTAWVDQRLGSLSRFYGTNDPASLEPVCLRLAEMAAAVTDGAVPAGLQEEAVARVREAARSLSHHREEFRDRLGTVPETVAGLPGELLESSSFFQRRLGCRAAVRRMPGWHYWPGMSVGWWLFRWVVSLRARERVQQPLSSHRSRSEELVSECRSDLRASCGPWERDGWYRCSGCRSEAHSRLKTARERDEETVGEAMEEVRARCERRKEHAVSMAEDAAAGRLPEIWKGSMSDRIGRFFAGNTGTKLLTVVAPLMVPYGAAMWLVSGGEHFVAGVIAVMALLWAALTWGYIDVCGVISGFVRNRYARLSTGDGAGTWDLDPGRSYEIGRNPENSIVLPDPKVSRRHALVACRGSDWFVRAAKGGNGTYLNGRRIRHAARLRHGQVLRMGATRLRFNLIRPGDPLPDACTTPEHIR